MKEDMTLRAIATLCKSLNIEYHLRHGHAKESNVTLPDTGRVGRTIYECLKLLDMPHELTFADGKALRFSEGKAACEGPLFEFIEVLAPQLGFSLRPFAVGEATPANRRSRKYDWDFAPVLEALEGLPSDMQQCVIELPLHTNAERSSFIALLRRKVTSFEFVYTSTSGNALLQATRR